jgi:phytanoyl-CoA dioxygenase PhyH
MSDDPLKTLDRDGVVRLDGLLSPQQLASMQQAFAARQRRVRWNHFDGYERTELHRHMLQDVLTLDQGFVDLALHPTVIAILRGYLGERFRLTEAKGWKSLPTNSDFHGWHGDAWYDQQVVREIPREVKLAFYLTDVTSGEFQYVRGTHRQLHPSNVSDDFVHSLDLSRVVRMTAPAGTGFLFDTSGIHRQAHPIVEQRDAVFYAYHDPSVPLQPEDVAYHRYHPLLLNAAFLGNLSAEDQRILGFGDKTHYIHAFEHADRFPGLQRAFSAALGARLRIDEFLGRVRARLRR